MGETWLPFPILQNRNLWLRCDEGANLVNGTNRWMLRSQVWALSALLGETSRLVEGLNMLAQDALRL